MYHVYAKFNPYYGMPMPILLTGLIFVSQFMELFEVSSFWYRADIPIVYCKLELVLHFPIVSISVDQALDF